MCWGLAYRSQKEQKDLPAGCFCKKRTHLPVRMASRALFRDTLDGLPLAVRACMLCVS
jgi:hypothetical protein